MSLAEEIKRVLMEHPEILVEVLTAKPEVIYEALAKLTPWQNLATKDDLKRLEEKMATKEDLKKLEEKMATKEELKRLEERVNSIEERMATKEDLKRLEERMATKEELRAVETSLREDMRKVEASLREDMRRLWLALNALGARWGVFSEDAFRSGVRELLKDAGYTVDRWVYYDDKGYVYGYPSEVELDIVIKDGRTLAVEITSALKRGDLQQIRRKVELFGMVTSRRVDAVYVITPFIHDKNPDAVAAVASSMGINVVWPRP
ncbi:PD-(D/E)XK nuclease family protein [Caldivirga sp. MU80]|uniref:PD-(D/E)XK nuclease family protein n=1 Tax=Caldivirga sp. MU80 TaxID=1650354 RepID=UPI000836FBCE|nr:PD-(D/E)XK nuclease family protein [Caldivirga sp. MU80]